MADNVWQELLDALVDSGKAQLDDIVDYLKNRSLQLAVETKDPALRLGKEYVQALLFEEAVQLIPAAGELTNEQLQLLSPTQRLARAQLHEKRAAQQVLILQAEAEHQEDAAEVRAKVKEYLMDVLKFAGKIGLKIVTGAVSGGVSLPFV